MPERANEAYLDHAATTPMRPKAVEAMLPYLSGEFANPSGAHRKARTARKAIDDAREVVADALGAAPAEVVFTAGGTEADNLAVLGVHDRRGGTTVCSAVEHHAVLEPVLSRRGGVVAVHSDGVIDLDALAATLEDARVGDGRVGVGVTLVSVMLVNNEIGVIQPLVDVADVVHEHAPDAVIHTDAVQAVTWLDVAALTGGADLVSIAGHKFGGPKGAGALVVRSAAEKALAPRLIGGGQESGRRAGTQNVAGIVAMAEALRLTMEQRADVVERVGKLRDRLASGLLASIPGVVETAASTDRVAGICHLCFEGVESEALLFLLEDAGVFASAGSSCASGAMEPSHVLTAMGVPRALALGAVRFSLGYASTDADVDLALDVVPAAVARLREST